MCFFITALVGREVFAVNETGVELVQNNLTYCGCNS